MELNGNNPAVQQNQPSELKLPGLLQKITGTIFSPFETAAAHEKKPTVLVPIIIVLILALGSILYLLLNYDVYKDATMTATGQIYEKMGMEITREQLEAYADMSLVVGFFTQPVTMLGGWLIGTLILYLAVRIFKGEGKIKNYISVTGYATIISILSLLLTMAVTYATGSFNLYGNYTSIATLLPQSLQGTFVYTFFSMIEIFTIWQYAIVAIGVERVSKLPRSKAYGIVGVLFLANVLLSSGMASINSMFS